jgi:hypothetical protein
MHGSAIVCAALVFGAAPMPPLPANQAPAPRLVKPDLSLVVLETLPDRSDPPRGLWDRPYRVVRIGFRNGRPLPAETVWEGPRSVLNSLWGARLVGGRYWVTASGGVFDLRENKLLSGEHSGWYGRIEETRVRFWIGFDGRENGEFTFEYATKTLRRVSADPNPWHDEFRNKRFNFSPSGSAAICWEEDEEELVLYRAGKPAKSLGTGFKRKAGLSAGLAGDQFPLLWLDEERVLTQRADGKLVTLDLTGKVTDLLTIPEDPKKGDARLSRDPNGDVVYWMDRTSYTIDVAKKSAEKSEWKGLGDGFEISRFYDEQERECLRYEGREIGRFKSLVTYWTRVAPGYLASVLEDEDELLKPDRRRRVIVWTATTEKWITYDFQVPGSTPIIGWIK